MCHVSQFSHNDNNNYNAVHHWSFITAITHHYCHTTTTYTGDAWLTGSTPLTCCQVGFQAQASHTPKSAHFWPGKMTCARTFYECPINAWGSLCYRCPSLCLLNRFANNRGRRVVDGGGRANTPYFQHPPSTPFPQPDTRPPPHRRPSIYRVIIITSSARGK